MLNRQRITLVVVGIGLVFTCIICLSLGAIYYLMQNDQLSLPFFEKSDNGIQSLEGSLPPLLSGESFPVSEIDYPSDWPTVLRFPKDFIVVELNSGSLNDDSSKGWVTKLRFWGEVDQAEDLLMAFFELYNWNIQEHINLNSGGELILIEQPENLMTGVIVMEPDTTDMAQTLIVVTVHLQLLD